MAHETFTIGDADDKINVSLHRCKEEEGFTEPLCLLSVNGTVSLSIIMTTKDLKKLGEQITTFIKEL